MCTASTPTVVAIFTHGRAHSPLVIHSALRQLYTSSSLAWSPRQSLCWLLSLTQILLLYNYYI